MYKHVYSENVHSIAICSITNSRSQRCQRQRRHLPKVHILYVNWVNIYNEYAKVYYHWWALLRGRSYFCNKSRRSPVSQHSFGVNTLFAYSHNHESRITITPSQPTENPDQTFVRKFILKGPPSGIHKKKKKPNRGNPRLILRFPTKFRDSLRFSCVLHNPWKSIEIKVLISFLSNCRKWRKHACR